MVKVFNSLNVQVSCLGNHDLDFGVAKMRELVGKTSQSCTWLLSNLYVDGKPIGDLSTYTTKTIELAGSSKRSIKIGFIGLAGSDWIG